MISKKASYLNERIYSGNGKRTVSPEIISYWSDLLGENYLSDIQEYDENVMDALSNNDYKCNEVCQDKFDKLSKLEKVLEEEDEYTEIILKMKNQLFFEFYEPFYKIALTYYDSRKMENQLIRDSDNEIKNCLLELLSARFEKVTTRVLLLELSICREEGLTGQTEEEKYITYARDYLSKSDYQNEILNIYPCLKRIMLESISMLVDNILEVTKNLCDDKKLIEEKLCAGKSFSRIARIKSEFSDSHNKGKTVFNIELDNKATIIYKPHSLECELAYQKILTWITKECGDTALNYKIIDRKNYGWEEKIEYRKCQNKNDVMLFYKRMGYILFVNYLLQVTDMHYENVIAHGSYPVIIDLETIMTNIIESKPDKTAKEIAYEKISRSVVSQGLLPKYVWGKGDKAGIDISGISGVAGQELPIKVPVLKNIKRADMHIEYEHPQTRDHKNIPKLESGYIMNEECTIQIVSGFSSAYRVALSHKLELGKKMKEFKDLTVRFIPRDTRQYTMLLQTSYHPDFMQDGADREILVSSLFQHNGEDVFKKLSEEEIKDILNGDIPYFTYKVNEKCVSSSNKRIIKDIFSQSSYEQLVCKMQTFSEEDLKEQCSYIMLSMAMNAKMSGTNQISPIRKKYSVSVNYNEVIANIFNQIYECAIFSERNEDVSWIGLSLVGSNENIWNVSPLTDSLYDGIAGVAVFAFALNKVTNNPKVQTLCTCIKNSLFDAIDRCLKEENPQGGNGAFSGNGSLMYVCQVLYKITYDNLFIQYMDKLYSKLDEIIENDQYNDIIYGNAGMSLIYLNAYDLTNEMKYLKSAIKAANILVSRAIVIDNKGVGWVGSTNQRPLAGFSHGNAGIALALLKIYDRTGDLQYYETAQRAILYENTLYRQETNNWLDMRIFNGVEVKNLGDPVSWCHGASGILLSRIKMLPYVNEAFREIIKSDIKKSIEKMVSNGKIQMQCLCHGNIGNIEILLEAARILGNNDLENFAKNILDKSVVEGSESGWSIGLTGKETNVGFMLGLSGIGYSLLRFRYPGVFPSILSVEI